MTGYNDPKVTKPVADNGSGRKIWLGVGAVVVLVALAWMFGLFGGGEAVAPTTDPAAIDAPADGAAAPEPATPATPAAPVD